MKFFKIRVNYHFVAALILTLLLVAPNQAIIAKGKKSNKTSEELTTAADSTEYKNLRFSILGGPGYTPDFGFLIGGSALMTFDMPGMKGYERRSTAPIAISLSIGEYMGVSVLSRPMLFMKQDQIRLTGEFVYSNLSNNYYGVGFERNNEVERGGATTQHFNSQVTVNPIILFRIPNSDWFVGPTLHLQYEKLTDIAEGMAEDPDYIAVGGTADGYSTLNNGVGFSINYDSRDIPANAYNGVYFDFKALAYGRYFGGDHNFQSLQIKYQQYKDISPKSLGRVFAWSVYTENLFGDVPFTRLSMVGSPFDLRGYYKGQYRDKSTHVAMVEYRHKFHVDPVNLLSKIANRIGLVAWGGIGLIGPSAFNIEGVLPNYGLGLRIELQPRMNFRMDIGRSPLEKQTLIYFNMTEAF